MACGAGTYKDDKQRIASFSELLSPVDKLFKEVIFHKEFDKVKYQGACINQLSLALEMMRGVARFVVLLFSVRFSCGACHLIFRVCFRSTGTYTFDMAFGYLSKYFEAFIRMVCLSFLFRF
jgi:hypothetical protein